MKSQNKSIFLRIISANFRLGWFSGIWAITLLVPLIYFPLPMTVAGHPWKVELTASLILSIALICLLIQKNKYDLKIPQNIFTAIIIPCLGFICFSAASAIWASSTLSVIHHTSVWICYLVFFLIALHIVSNNKLLTLFISSAAVMIGIIAVLSVIEYTFAENIGEVFGFRYSRFAEIHTAMLPLILSFTLRFNKKKLILAYVLTSLVWLAILYSMSRGALLSTIVGLGVFILLRLLSKIDLKEKKRLIILALVLAFVGGFSQISFLKSFQEGEQKVTVLNRLTSIEGDDGSNSFSKNIRILFANVGLEMFKDNVLTGVGADNFGLEFNKYRAIVSANEANKYIVGQQEARIAERTHNEYLQILTELGIIGGILFLLFLLGIAKIGFIAVKHDKNSRSNLLVHASIAGIISFLISSMFSSFSFRLMQNGLVFFFLLALLVRNQLVNKSQESKTFLATPKFRSIAASIALLLCLSVTIISVIRAISLYLVFAAERQPDSQIAKSSFNKAISLDPANGAANFSLGLRLLEENNYSESAFHFQKAIDKGLNSTAAYSYLITAESLANDSKAADQSFNEAIKIFPYSLFLRVRYASFLNNIGNEVESQKQLEIAKQLGDKQAEGWWILINKGQIALLEKSAIDKGFPNKDLLLPQEAVGSVLFERETRHPDEIIKFNFGK